MAGGAVWVSRPSIRRSRPVSGTQASESPPWRVASSLISFLISWEESSVHQMGSVLVTAPLFRVAEDRAATG